MPTKTIETAKLTADQREQLIDIILNLQDSFSAETMRESMFDLFQAYAEYMSACSGGDALGNMFFMVRHLTDSWIAMSDIISQSKSN